MVKKSNGGNGNFVNEVYSAVDEAATCELERLRNEDGVSATCKSGCSHCCRYHILTNITEADTLAQYVKDELSEDQLKALQLRTKQWHEWDNSAPGRHPSSNIEETTDIHDHVHSCPLLVDGKCCAYPVRPFVCRTHFVSSSALNCSAVNDPNTTEERPVVLKSVVTAASPFLKAIKIEIENSGLEFSRSKMLLPHWLAIKMDWDFAITN